MGKEIDLLVNYPRTKRDVQKRGAEKTEEDRAVARQFGRDFFDGDRRHGYGGFCYHPRFWQPVIPTFRKFYGLTAESSLLDVGCAKGFMLHDFAELIPGITVNGVDTQNLRFTMVDMQGRVVKDGDLFARNTINTASLSQGLYVLNLIDNNRVVSAQKFIKE